MAVTPPRKRVQPTTVAAATFFGPQIPQRALASSSYHKAVYYIMMVLHYVAVIAPGTGSAHTGRNEVFCTRYDITTRREESKCKRSTQSSSYAANITHQHSRDPCHTVESTVTNACKHTRQRHAPRTIYTRTQRHASRSYHVRGCRTLARTTRLPYP